MNADPIERAHKIWGILGAIVSIAVIVLGGAISIGSNYQDLRQRQESSEREQAQDKSQEISDFRDLREQQRIDQSFREDVRSQLGSLNGKVDLLIRRQR